MQIWVTSSLLEGGGSVKGYMGMRRDEREGRHTDGCRGAPASQPLGISACMRACMSTTFTYDLDSLEWTPPLQRWVSSTSH